MQLLLLNDDANQCPNNRQTDEDIFETNDQQSRRYRTNANDSARPKGVRQAPFSEIYAHQKRCKIGNHGDTNPAEVDAEGTLNNPFVRCIGRKIFKFYLINVNQSQQNAEHQQQCYHK